MKDFNARHKELYVAWTKLRKTLCNINPGVPTPKQLCKDLMTFGYPEITAKSIADLFMIGMAECGHRDATEREANEQ